MTRWKSFKRVSGGTPGDWPNKETKPCTIGTDFSQWYLEMVSRNQSINYRPLVLLIFKLHPLRRPFYLRATFVARPGTGHRQAWIDSEDSSLCQACGKEEKASEHILLKCSTNRGRLLWQTYTKRWFAWHQRYLEQKKFLNIGSTGIRETTSLEWIPGARNKE